MIIVGGENLMDMIQTGRQNNNALFEAVPGGSPYNLAMAVGRQNIAVSYMTPISRDSSGDQLAEKLVESRVNLRGPRVSAPTSIGLVSIEDGAPSYAFYREGTAERLITLDHLEASLTDDVSVFHIGSLGLTGGNDAIVWEEFAKRAKNRGIKLSIDPNVRPSLISDPSTYRSRITRLIAMADILKLSDEDLAWLYCGMNESESLMELTANTSADVIILTKGADGSAVQHNDVWHDAPSHPVGAISDTIGAGDTYMASILVWLTQNLKLARLSELSLQDKQQMQHYAGRAAALNCARQGCNPPWADELR